jgi:GNAT superfamily N-acetyltransferase
MDMLFLPNDNNSNWLSRSPTTEKNIVEAYKATIPKLTFPLHFDGNFRSNSHIINQDFDREPKYLAAFRTDDKERLLILSSLYVYPEHRKTGIGRKLIDQLKAEIEGKKFVIQVAVETQKLGRLHKYYTGQGFITTGVVNNKGLTDFFWADHKMKLMMSPDNKYVLIDH